MPKGDGPKSGRGRKLSAATRISRDLANMITESGKAPLNIMWDNMLFWANQVTEITDELKGMIVNAENEDERAEAFALLKRMLSCRENAQRCAVDMAPYCHPKLQSISLDGKKKDLASEVLPTDQIEASKVYQKLIGQAS